MGSDDSHVTYVDTITDYRPGEDSTHGAIGNYGEAINNPDIGTSIWRFDSAATGTGEYSEHKEGIIKNLPFLGTTTSAANGVTPGPNRRYTLVRGLSYRLEFTFENIGYTDPTTTTFNGFLSSDTSLGSPDYSFGSWTISPASFTRDAWPLETYIDIKIPIGAPLGLSYVGIVMNCTVTGTIGCNDVNTWNQSTYYAVNIVNPPPP